MTAARLEQYLASVLQVISTDTNEVCLKPVNSTFDLFTIYLENHNTGLHRYQTARQTIIFMVAGTINIKINGKNIRLATGNSVFLEPKCEYDVPRQTKEDIIVKFEFTNHLNFLNAIAKFNDDEQKIVSQIKLSLKTERLLYLKNSKLAKPTQLMRRIVDEYLNQNLFTSEMISAELMMAFLTTIRNQKLSALPLVNYEFAETTLDQYIDENFAHITLEQTAKHFGLNPNYFSTLVKQKTGKSFVEHVDERRMQEARTLLARPDISVRDIISQVGYSGKSFFYKKFNEYYHETPVQMRTELFRQANINLK
ncbi:AraC family transcriptional regulator [Lactobacillus sp. ESL0236]|uniref:helix-turn-helix transcriptional regulator n=1 Tax=unclassified Lactobacillus TaxID=2620435 RepID=UPI000EFCEC65|nr:MULTISPECIES: AraC family transcriptional regulator [unclassified Lactobacillus]RMC41952.1 AraC family transcriptional regulator [Lactobacillus sp. ESL0237]RMC45559.1 AraC family transcriptional regulator [Lactobacillus sp. ESL0234]RMC46945.1 AraC family transcriptional regulator [Lactobacillus sp. ESL0236]